MALVEDVWDSTVPGATLKSKSFRSVHIPWIPTYVLSAVDIPLAVARTDPARMVVINFLFVRMMNSSVVIGLIGAKSATGIYFDSARVKPL